MAETMTAFAFIDYVKERRPFQFFAYRSDEQQDSDKGAPVIAATFRKVELCDFGGIQSLFFAEDPEVKGGATLTVRRVKSVIIGDLVYFGMRNVHLVSAADETGKARVTTFRTADSREASNGKEVSK